MILSGDEILARGLITNGNTANVRAASYDLSVGRIITVEGKDIRSFNLEPQGIIEIISRETVDMPEDIVGFAMVKTSLCDKGILALNIGIVDPLYKGNISTTLLNFSKNTFQVEKGDIFLRLTIHECTPSQNYGRPVTIPIRDYVKSKKDKVSKFASTFLNLDNSVKKITDPIYTSAKSDFLRWLGGSAIVAGIMLALFPFLVALAIDWSRTGITKESVKAELLKEISAEKQNSLDDRIKILEEREKLEERVKQLEEQIDKINKQKTP